jgi:hypothetical protein
MDNAIMGRPKNLLNIKGHPALQIENFIDVFGKLIVRTAIYKILDG